MNTGWPSRSSAIAERWSPLNSSIVLSSSAEIQRAVSHGEGSKLASTLYSAWSREISTSSWSWPTTPTIHCEPIDGWKTCMIPSSAMSLSALRNCLVLVGSPSARGAGSRARSWAAGEADHLALGQRIADAQRAMVGNADDVARKGLLGQLAIRARNRIGLWTAIDLPVPTWLSFMPRRNLPAHSRMKATRSRCCGFMFACTLKMKPGDVGLARLDLRADRRLRARRRREFRERIDQLLDPEILERRPEIDRGEIAIAR
jgi:hypothetical protein